MGMRRNNRERKMKQFGIYTAIQSLLVVMVMICTVARVEAEESDEVFYIEEVIVSAQRRGPENLQNVPMSVSVIGSETIEKSGLLQMDDFLRALPSTNFLERGAGRNNIIIRGIAADPQFDDTVGVYIGETPVTDTANNGSPDLRLVDIQRIEVLRGPQGTLYGDGSMGGTVRVIPVPPDLSDWEVLLTGGIESTEGTGGSNNIIEAVLNLPVAKDEAALRFVAYRHDFRGYINNIAGSDPEKQYWAEKFGGLAVDKNHVGSSVYTGGRLQFLWQPNPNLKLTLMTLTQDLDQTGLPEAELNQGDFNQSRFLKYDGSQESLDMDFDLASALIEYDFRRHSLLSSTSWMKSRSSYDRNVGFFDAPLVGADDMPEFQLFDNRFDTWVQEFRLISRTDRKFQYMFGLFYQDLTSDIIHKITFEGDPALDPFNGETLLDAVGEWDEDQLALFGNLTYDFTDRLSTSFGARFFKYKQQTLWYGGGLFSADAQGRENKDNGSTLSFDVNYIINDTTMIYGRFAQGFRLGRPLGDIPDYCDADGDGLLDGLGVPEPTSVDPDDLDSLEAGTKFSLAGGRLQLNATLFTVKWDGIPIWVAPTCGWGTQLNAGKAKSRGAEIEGFWAITSGVRANFAASWVDPELTEDAPGLGSDGDRLPGSPKYNLSLGVQGDFDIADKPAFVRADLVYVGEFYNNLQQAGTAAGGYTTLGLRGGVNLGRFQLNAYINNATDQFARTWIGSELGMGRNYVIRPRTIGLQLRYLFAQN